MRGAISAPRVKHRAATTDPAAFGPLRRAIDGFRRQPPTVAALKLLPLVFTRPGELRLAEWSEFDVETMRLWRVRPSPRWLIRHVVT